MINVTTGHKHTFLANIYMLTANCARRRLKSFSWTSNFSWLYSLLFTMFFFNFDNWKLLNCFFFCSILLSFSFVLLFRDSTNHFKNFISWIKTWVIIVHEVAWRNLSKRCLHPQKLMPRKQVLKTWKHSDECSCKPFNVLIDSFLFLVIRNITSVILVWAWWYLYMDSWGSLLFGIISSHINNKLRCWRHSNVSDA